MWQRLDEVHKARFATAASGTAARELTVVEGILRIVLDTDVMVAALRSDRGASRRLVLAALDRDFELLLSVPLMIEYEAVLTRPEHLQEIGLTAREVNEVLDALVRVSIQVPLRFLWRPRLRDPADEMVLETAVKGGADWLVTFYVRHLAAGARDFGIRVMRPPDAWKVVHKHQRLQASLLDEARRVSEAEGVALNQIINVAVAEKLSALRTEEYFRERGQRGNVGRAKRLLKRAGRGNPAVPDDELK